MCLVCIHRIFLENSQRDSELLDRVELDTSFLDQNIKTVIVSPTSLLMFAKQPSR